jgi:hypothetical protein
VQRDERGHGKREDENGGPGAFGDARVLDAEQPLHHRNGQSQSKRTNGRLSKNTDDAHLNLSSLDAAYGGSRTAIHVRSKSTSTSLLSR